MSTITANEDAFAPQPHGRGFFRRAFDRLVALRQQQADQAIASYLLSLDDVSIEARGHDRTRLARLATKARPFI